MSGRFTALLVIQLVHNSTYAFSGRAIRSFYRVVCSSVPGQGAYNRTTELLQLLKMPQYEVGGEEIRPDRRTKTANELRRAELGQPTSPIHLPTPGHPKLGSATELPLVRKEIPWC
jgi:hypothetical protein